MLLGWVLDETARVSSEACVSLFFQTTKAFLPTMLEINHGHIVTVASSLGLFSTAGVEVCQTGSISFIQLHSLVTSNPQILRRVPAALHLGVPGPAV